MKRKKIIFDIDGVLFDPHETRCPYPEACEVLTELKNDFDLIILSAGNEMDQLFKLATCEITSHILDVWIVKSGEEKLEALRQILEENSRETLLPQDHVVVGDRIDLEIKFGNRLGCATIRVQRGKYADATPRYEHEQPTFTIRSLRELPPLVMAL